MAGDIKLKYAASTVAMTVTNLHSLPAAQILTSGWGSASVSNLSNQYRDYAVSASLVTHASNRQVGSIELWVCAALNDTPTFHTPSSGTIGTEGTVVFAAAETKYSYCRRLAGVTVTNTASQVYSIPPLTIARLFGDACPTHWALFITGSATTGTSAQFASSGSAVWYTPIVDQYT